MFSLVNQFVMRLYLKIAFGGVYLINKKKCVKLKDTRNIQIMGSKVFEKIVDLLQQR